MTHRGHEIAAAERIGFLRLDLRLPKDGENQEFEDREFENQAFENWEFENQA